MLLTIVSYASYRVYRDTNNCIVSLATKGPRQPRQPDSVYEWIQQSLISRTNVPFLTLSDIQKKWTNATNGRSAGYAWAKVAPRTAMFVRLFSVIRPDMTSAEFVEAMLSAGMDNLVLETFPEAISAPMREAIAECQMQPPVSWNEHLLSLIGRDDLNSLAQRRKVCASSLSKVSPLIRYSEYEWRLKDL